MINDQPIVIAMQPYVTKQRIIVISPEIPAREFYYDSETNEFEFKFEVGVGEE